MPVKASAASFSPSTDRAPSLTGVLIALALWCFAGLAGAQGLGSTSSNSPFGTSSTEEFLPVEEAYVLDPYLQDNELVLQWTIAPGYYLYQDQFRFSARGLPTEAELQPQFEPGKQIFDEYFNKELTVYYQETEVRLQLPQVEEAFELAVISQGCADAGLCYPPRTQYLAVDPSAGTVEEIAAPARGAATPAETPQDSASAPTEAPFLPWILLGALLGGVILNLMPCVFPVLSLKALSFASSGMSAHKQHIHGWAYTAGIMVSFLLAATIILAARTAGQSVGWGFQLQSPVFVALMTYLFFAMALSLLGFFHLGTRLMGLGQSLTGGHGLQASFFTGVLAALVASPCTAPFMATALGYAVTQPAYVALAVFGALGLGMALPFLLLSYSPRLAQRLPKPGAWMETLKQLLAFPLLLTCVWLLWVLGNQVSSDAVAALVLGAVAIAFGCWLWQQSPQSRPARAIVRILALAAVAAALVLAAQIRQFKDAADAYWQPYSPDTLASLRASEAPVFINLTADWCITCLANDRVALHTDAVRSTAEDLGVVMLKGDWTNGDPNITRLLNEYGRSGVPLYLMYPASEADEAEVLPQILTKQIVIDAMHRAVE